MTLLIPQFVYTRVSHKSELWLTHVSRTYKIESGNYYQNNCFLFYPCHFEIKTLISLSSVSISDTIYNSDTLEQSIYRRKFSILKVCIVDDSPAWGVWANLRTCLDDRSQARRLNNNNSNSTTTPERRFNPQFYTGHQIQHEQGNAKIKTRRMPSPRSTKVSG